MGSSQKRTMIQDVSKQISGIGSFLILIFHFQGRARKRKPFYRRASLAFTRTPKFPLSFPLRTLDTKA